MKFRPVLTHSQILYLIHLCKKEINNPDSLSCLTTLVPFEHKISNQCITPAYTGKDKESKLDELGFSHTSSHNLNLDAESLHSRYLQSGEDVGEFTVTEIQRIKEYRYTNDLMSPEEEHEYEQMVLPQLSHLYSE